MSGSHSGAAAGAHSLVPGAVASAPYVALLWGEPHNLHGFVDDNQGAATAAAVVLVIAVGLLVESIGSCVEYYVVYKKHLDRGEMLNRWRDYLRLAWKTEPIGQHYLRRILTVFKFELNLLVASASTLPATLALGYFNEIPVHGIIAISLLTLALSYYLCVASVASSVLLDSLRQQLVAQARSSGELKP